MSLSSIYIIVKIIEAIITNLPKLVDAGIKMMIKLIEGFVKAVPKFIAKIPEIMNKLVNGLANYVGRFSEVGANLIRGLWSGISNLTSWIIGKIKSFGSSVLKAIKGIFGVHSPSTEFEWIGKMNIIGLEKGMEELQPQLQKTIDGVFDLQPNVSGTMNSTYSPNLNVVVNNNMEFDPLGQVVNNIKMVKLSLAIFVLVFFVPHLEKCSATFWRRECVVWAKCVAHNDLIMRHTIIFRPFEHF